MFRIGDFSRLTRISVKMLRHYDEIGLLPPAFVDPTTGYRLYAAHQLPRLNRIIALKDLGFSLGQIGILLDEGLSPEALRGMLTLRQHEIESRLRVERERLARVEFHVRQLAHEGQPPPYDIVLRPVEPQLMACMRCIASDLEGAVTTMFDSVEAYVASARARAAAAPVLLYHDAEFRGEDADVEVAVPLSAPISPSGAIVIRELEGAPTMACVVYEGAYDRLVEALQAVLRWVEASGYAVAGPVREVYLQFCAGRAAEWNLPGAFLTAAPADLITEVQIPVVRDGMA